MEQIYALIVQHENLETGEVGESVVEIFNNTERADEFHNLLGKNHTIEIVGFKMTYYLAFMHIDISDFKPMERFSTEV